jgi:hypothetical protein
LVNIRKSNRITGKSNKNDKGLPDMQKNLLGILVFLLLSGCTKELNPLLSANLCRDSAYGDLLKKLPILPVFGTPYMGKTDGFDDLFPHIVEISI